MRSLVPWIAPFFLIGVLAGCGGEDRLYDTPRTSPPATPPPIRRRSRSRRRTREIDEGDQAQAEDEAEPKAEVPPPGSPGQ